VRSSPVVNGRLFSVAKTATPSGLLQRREARFGLRTCKAAMLQVRVSAARVVQPPAGTLFPLILPAFCTGRLAQDGVGG